MKKILVILPVIALVALAITMINASTVTTSYAAESKDTTAKKIRLDDLSPREKREIESITGRKVEDLTREEIEDIENVTLDDLRRARKKLDEDAKRQRGNEPPPLTGSNFPPVSPELFKEYDVEELAFAKGKEGCGMKLSLFYVASKQYENGESLDDMSDSKIMEPLFEKFITAIKEKGAEQANLDNLKEYEACVAKYEDDADPRSKRHDACSQLNSIVMDSIGSIKKREKAGTVISRYERTKIDLSQTAYKDIEDPVPLFIGKLYMAAEKGGIKNASALASSITIGCVN